MLDVFFLSVFFSRPISSHQKNKKSNIVQDINIHWAYLHEIEIKQSHQQTNQLMLMIKLYVKLTQIKMFQRTKKKKRCTNKSNENFQMDKLL